MNRSALPLVPLAGLLLCSGCVTKLPAQWTTINPADIEPSPRVTAAGPFHLYHLPSIALINFDEHYSGDDTPWIDLDDGFRGRIAEAMDGYDPATITLGDLAVARYAFLEERLGEDFFWKQLGREDEELMMATGKKWEGLDKYSFIRTMYPSVFRDYKLPAERKIVIRVVSDIYRVLPGKAPPVRDITIYLSGLRDDEGMPIPKTTFTQMEDELVRQIAVEGTERAVPGGTAVDVVTPRGRFTVYQSDRETDPSFRWTVRLQDVWHVGKALVDFLNRLPEETLQRFRDAKN